MSITLAHPALNSEMSPAFRLPFFYPDYTEPDGWGHLDQWSPMGEGMHFLTQKEGVESNKIKTRKEKESLGLQFLRVQPHV